MVLPLSFSSRTRDAGGAAAHSEKKSKNTPQSCGTFGLRPLLFSRYHERNLASILMSPPSGSGCAGVAQQNEMAMVKLLVGEAHAGRQLAPLGAIAHLVGTEEGEGAPVVAVAREGLRQSSFDRLLRRRLRHGPQRGAGLADGRLRR